MLSEIKNILKRWPSFYHCVKMSYYFFREVIETKILGTRFQEWIWKTRHLYKDRDWGIQYLQSVDHPHREQVITAIAFFYPFKRVLEIGCNAGPNLILLSKKFPDVKFIGVDINKKAIEIIKEHVMNSDIKNIEVFVGKADQLSWIEDKNIDVVFTDAVLMFVGPDKIRKVLKEMHRVVCKGLVLNEYHSDNPPMHNYDGGRFVYNYHQLLRECFPSAKYKIRKSSFSGGLWDKYGALIEVNL